MNKINKKKILIIGLGSIGKRHAKILLNEFDYEIYALRSKREGHVNSLGIKELHNWLEVQKIKPDIAFITNPTSLHIDTAIRCASLGMQLFIEKALSNTLTGLAELKIICQKNQLTTYIAYNMRFHEVLIKVKELIKDKKILHIRTVCSSFLPNWRPGTNHLKSYSALSSQGGGIILDSSHELDYLNFLFGPLQSIRGNFGKINNVTVDVEDYANILATLKNGLIANIHLNFMSLIRERKLTIDFQGGYCIADLEDYSIIWNDDGKEDRIKFDKARNIAYKKQIEYFLNNLNNQQIMNNLDEGISLLKMILQFKEED